MASAGQIRATIQANNDLIIGKQQYINNLENKIYQLQRLKEKVSKLQYDFGEKQKSRKSKLSGLSGKIVRVKMFSTYLSNMNTLLSSTDYTNAYNGLTEAQNNVDGQIRSIQNEINECRNSISYLEGRNNYWNEQLKNVSE